MKPWVVVLILVVVFVGSLMSVAVVGVVAVLALRPVEDTETTPPEPPVAQLKPPVRDPEPLPPLDIGGEVLEPPPPIVVPRQFQPTPRVEFVPNRGMRPDAMPEPLQAAIFPEGVSNSNALIRKHWRGVTATASTAWTSWPAAHAIDGNEETSWFSQGQRPNSPHWIRVEFPEPERVSRVTVLGNRDPKWPGYFIEGGKVELQDAKGTILASEELKPIGSKHDFDLRLPAPVAGVTAVRFSVTAREPRNVGHEAAVGEILVE